MQEIPNRPDADPRRSARKTLLILIGVAVLLMILNVLLLGLPGAAVMTVAKPLAKLFSDKLIDGDALWPAAIMIGFIAPWTLPAAYYVAPRLGTRARGVVTACLAAFASLALTVAVMVGGGAG